MSAAAKHFVSSHNELQASHGVNDPLVDAVRVGTFEKKEITIYGEKPWGFTLNGGCHFFQPLIITKVSYHGFSNGRILTMKPAKARYWPV